MARFDAYRRQHAVLLDVQADWVLPTPTRVVVPLYPRHQAAILRELTPVFDLEGEQRVMSTHLLLSLPTRRLGAPTANLAHHQDEITRALDVLLTGF